MRNDIVATVFICVLYCIVFLLLHFIYFLQLYNVSA